jgi:hypothetical protein
MVEDGREADSTTVEMSGGSRELWLLRLPSAVAQVCTVCRKRRNEMKRKRGENRSGEERKERALCLAFAEPSLEQSTVYTVSATQATDVKAI